MNNISVYLYDRTGLQSFEHVFTVIIKVKTYMWQGIWTCVFEPTVLYIKIREYIYTK